MNTAEERATSVAARASRWLSEGWIDAATRGEVETLLRTPWRTNGVVLQVVFFVLTAIAIGALYGLCDIFGFDKPGIPTGIVAIALAELLIRRRWWATGVEAALWIGGIFALIASLPRSGTPEAMLVMAAGAAVAGARLRQPLFGAVACCFVIVYAEERFNLGVVCALLIAAIALVALTREWRRPSTEWLWIAILLVSTAAGRFTADTAWRPMTVGLYAAFGICALAAAIGKRHHAMFLAAFLAIGIAATDGALLLPVAAEVEFAVGGAILLVVAWIVARTIRDREHGFVLHPEQLTPADDAIAIAAAMSMPHASPEAEPVPPQQTGGGGQFGGAGATGDY